MTAETIASIIAGVEVTYTRIRGSTGFDRDDEGGEAIRKQYVTRKPKKNANDNRQLAAA